MNDLSAMYVLEGHANLDEPLEDLHLTERTAILLHTLDMIGQISYFTVLHDDHELVWSQKTFFVLDNVRMLQILQ